MEPAHFPLDPESLPFSHILEIFCQLPARDWEMARAQLDAARGLKELQGLDRLLELEADVIPEIEL